MTNVGSLALMQQDTSGSEVSDTSDESLMLRYAKGETFAFDALYRRHRLPLYRFFVRGTRDETIAEELYQDVWTQLINHRKRYQHTARFTTYLYGVANNRLIDHYRRSSVRESAVHLVRESSDADELADDLDQSRIIKRLADALLKLPLDQRSAFVLQRETGFSVAELAEICHTGVETMKSRLRLAVSKLRAELRNEND